MTTNALISITTVETLLDGASRRCVGTLGSFALLGDRCAGARGRPAWIGRRASRMSSQAMGSDTRVATSGSRIAGVASLASAALAGVAVVLLVAMFVAFGVGATSTGRAVGKVNDMLTLLAYPLAVPGVLATAALLRSRRPRLVGIGTLVAIAAIVAITVLQWQLVTGVLTFDQQIGPVSIAFLALGAWFVISAYVGAGLLPYGVGIGVLAALYIGFPVLTFRLGRFLLGRRR